MRKERYSLRKSKLGTVSALVGLSIVGGLALGGAEVHAAEGDSVLTSSTGENYSVSDEQIKDREKKVEDKKAEIIGVEKKADDKAKEIEKNQEEVKQKSEDKKQKEEKVTELEEKIKKADLATPQKIQSVKDDITNKETEVTDKENEKNTADRDVKEKEDSKRDIDKNVSDKEKEVNDAKTQKDAAKADVDNKEKELNPQKVLDLENEKNKSEKELSDKERDINSKQQDIDTATTDVENAKEADKRRQKAIDDVKVELTRKETEKKNKEDSVKEKEKEVEKLQKEVENAFPYPTHFKSTPEWLAAFKELLDARADARPEKNPNKYPEYPKRAAYIEYPKKDEYPKYPNMEDYRNSEGRIDFVEYDKAVEQHDEVVDKIDEKYKKAIEEYDKDVEKKDTEYNKAVEEFEKAVEEYKKKTGEWKKDNLERQQKAFDKAYALDEAAKEAYEEYVNEFLNKIPNNENEEKLDPNNLPEDVLLEINEYFVTLVNSLRTQLGLPEATLNKNNINFAKEVAATVVRDKFLIQDHYGKGVNEVADKRGLKKSADLGVMTTNQSYENLMNNTTRTMKITKSELYKEIVRTTHLFFYEGNQNYGHAFSLTSVENIGGAFSILEGNERPDLYYYYDENWNEIPRNTLKWHILSVSSGNLVDESKAGGTFDDIYGSTSPNNVAKKIYKTREEVERDLEVAKRDLKTAEDELNTVTRDVDNTKEDVKNKENVPLQTPNAEEKLEKEKEELRKLQDEKEKIKEKLEKTKKNLEDAKLDEKNKQDQLTILRRNLQEKEDTLNTKERELTQLKNDAKTAEKDLEDSKKNAEQKNNELEKAKEDVTKLKDELKELEDLVNSRSQLERDLTDAKKVLKDSEDELNSKQDELRNNQIIHTNLLNQIKQLQRELKTLEDDYKNTLDIYTKERLPEPEKLDPRDEKPEVRIVERVREEVIRFNTIEQEDSTLQIGERVVKVVGKNGKKSIKTTQFIVGIDVLDTKVDETILEEKVDEIILIGPKNLPTDEDRPKVDIKEETKEEVIHYKVIEQQDPTLRAGQRVVKVVGKNGKKTVKTTQFSVNGQVVDTKTDETVLEEAVDQIVLVGTKKTTNVKVEVRDTYHTDKYPYQVIVRQDPTLLRGQRVVKVVGAAGERVYRVTTTLEDGVVVNTRETLLSTQNPIDEIILEGTRDLKPGQRANRVEVRNGRLPYRTITRNNPNLELGQVKVVQRGVEGSFKIVRDDIYEGDILVEKGMEFEIERVESINEIIEIGTKKSRQDEIKPPKKDEEAPRPPKKDERRNNPLVNDGKQPREEKTSPRTNEVIRHLPNTDADATNKAGVGMIGLVAAAIIAKRRKENK